MSNRGESEIHSVLESLRTNPDRGLSEVEAYSRFRRFGANELERPYLLSRRVRFAALFCLAVGTVLAAECAFWHALATAVVGVALMVLASDLRKRYRQRVIASEDQLPATCSGIRGGRLVQVPVYQLVPGDIVRIQAGEMVPADGRLTEAVNLMIQESVLSGSPEPVEKDALQPDDPSTPSGESRNQVFMTTVAVRGRGTFVVTRTGKNTRIGLARALARKRGSRSTDLQANDDL